MLVLRFSSGQRAGEVVALNKNKVTFGRHVSCDCLLKHPTVSREHFYVERVGGKYFAVDQGSGNGTFANGHRITWVELKSGDRIQAGPFSFTVEAAEDGQAEPQRQPSRESLPDDYLDADTQESEPSFSEAHERIYPREYIEGIRHFNARRYYEAHEVWEEIWLRSSGATKLFYQMLIQAAVGLHHFDRSNARGARGMHKAVTEKLAQLPGVYMSLDLKDFSRRFESFFRELIENDDEAAPTGESRPVIRLIEGEQDQ